MKLTATVIIIAFIIALIPQCQKNDNEYVEEKSVRYDSMMFIAQALMDSTDSLICETDSIRCILKKKSEITPKPKQVIVLPSDRPYRHINKNNLK